MTDLDAIARELAEALAAVAASGFRINNLFQVDGSTWQANLYRPPHASTFARAERPGLALMQCAADVKAGRLVDLIQPPPAPKPPMMQATPSPMQEPQRAAQIMPEIMQAPPPTPAKSPVQASLF